MGCQITVRRSVWISTKQDIPHDWAFHKDRYYIGGPEHVPVETKVESNTLSPTFFIGGRDSWEFAVPRLAAQIPSGHLEDAVTLSESFNQENSS